MQDMLYLFSFLAKFIPNILVSSHSSAYVAGVLNLNNSKFLGKLSYY